MTAASLLFKLRQVQPFLIFRRLSPSQEQVAHPVRPARPLLWKSNPQPLEWLLDPDKSALRKIEQERRAEVWPDTERILARLTQLAAHEQDVSFCDDIRQAFVLVALAAKGHPRPLAESSRICYGLYPEQVWPALVAKRKLDLGSEYSQWYDHNDNLRPNPDLLPCPRKPVQSVRTLLKENTDAA